MKIQVQDLNDNIPQFIYPETTKQFKKMKYYGAIARDRKEVGGIVLQVKVRVVNKVITITYIQLTNNSPIGQALNTMNKVFGSGLVV